MNPTHIESRPFESLTAAEAPQAFLDDLLRWRSWVASTLESEVKRLNIARTKPLGARHDGNLYRDEQGRVWNHSFRWVAEGTNPYHRTQNVIEEMRRSVPSLPYSKYQVARVVPVLKETVGNGSVLTVETSEGPITFVARSCGDTAEDFGWTCPDPYGERGTAYFIEKGLESTKRGLAFADYALARKEDIIRWFHAWTETHPDRSNRAILDQETNEFWRLFGNGETYSTVPDTGSLHCFIHLVLDKMAGCPYRAYFC
jgi:hypothetical protein